MLSLLLRHRMVVELAHGLHLLLCNFAAYSRFLLRSIGRRLPVQDLVNGMFVLKYVSYTGCLSELLRLWVVLDLLLLLLVAVLVV